MNSRLLIIIAFITVLAGRASAQVGFIPNTGYRLSAGVGAGMSILWGDLQNKKIQPVGIANIEYRVKEFITVGLQAHAGTLESGMKNAVANEDGRYPKNVSYGLHSKNSFWAVNVNGKVAIGQFNKNTGGIHDYINGIYVGAGVGVINNNITEIVRAYPENNKTISGIIPTSMEIAIPVNIGFSVDIPSTRFSGVFNILQSFQLGEGIDGYDFGVSKVKDSYSVISVGVKYNFGPLL